MMFYSFFQVSYLLFKEVSSHNNLEQSTDQVSTKGTRTIKTDVTNSSKTPRPFFIVDFSSI